MIPREILKKIRQIKLGTKRLVTGLAGRGCVRIPTGFRLKARGCAPGATLGHLPANIINRNAVAAIPFPSATHGICHNPVGVDENLIPFTQGSSCVATLGCMSESRWDSPMAANSARAGFFILHFFFHHFPMIPREILKNIRQIELGTKRLMTGLAECGCVRIPTGFCLKAQGCEERATLGHRSASIINRNAVAAIPFPSATHGICHNPVGVDENLIPFTQGSSGVATLGCMSESRWDSLLTSNSARAGFFILHSSFIISP